MRKIKLDRDDVDTPAGFKSTARIMMFVFGIFFLFGYNMASYSLWVIVDLRMGLAFAGRPC